MKIVIEIRPELYAGIKAEKNIWTELELAVLDGTPLPEHATNGDVIKALFPDARVDDYDYGKDPVIDVYGIDDTEYITVRKNWWNAQYERNKE